MLLIGIAGGFLAYTLIGHYFFTTHPDYNIGVTLNTYTLDYTQSAEGETESDAYLTMAGTVSWPPMCRAP